MVSKPYPVPLSRSQPPKQQSTQYIDRDVDKEIAEFAEFRIWKQQQLQREAREQQERQQQEQQQQQQQQWQQVQLRPQPQPPAVMPQFSQNMRPYRQDSGFVDGQYDLGQMHGLPGQRQVQSFAYRPGHSYGTVTAVGNARVVRGNVIDSGRGNAQWARQHEYGQGQIGDQARMFDGDVTTDQMKDFWN